MKIFEKLDSKKTTFCKNNKQIFNTFEKGTKLNKFFYVFQKLVRYNIISKPIYILILIIEYMQLFYQLINDGEDYVFTYSEYTYNQSAFGFNKILQIANYLIYLSPKNISYSTFIVIYFVVSVVLILNFLILYLLDLLNQKYNENLKLKFVHSILGFFNYVNMKILIIPTNYILLQSFNIHSYYDSNSNEDIYYNIFDTYIIKILSVIVLLINAINLTQNSLLFNDLDPIESSLCWAQSYPEIEMFNIILKLGLSYCNYLKGNFIFIKSLFVLIINIQRCTYRYSEWYYSWSKNQIILIILDFGFLTFNAFSLFFPSSFKDINVLINLLIISSIIGFLFYIKIETYQKNVLNKSINILETEWEYCVVIIRLIRIIKNSSKDSKSLVESEFLGYITDHIKTCNNSSFTYSEESNTNKYNSLFNHFKKNVENQIIINKNFNHCFSKTIIQLITEKSCKINIENEMVELTKDEFNTYNKVNLKENAEILTDKVKLKCKKVLYSIIKCLLINGLNKFKKPRFLPILEAHLYLRIYDNTFYALFQINKFYKTDLSHREKFFFFSSLSHVLEKMIDKCSDTIYDVTQVSNYYFLHEKFTLNINNLLKESKNLFESVLNNNLNEDNKYDLNRYASIIYKKINQRERTNYSYNTINNSLKIGKILYKLIDNYQKIMLLNPKEINILRIFTFLTDKIFNMKKYSLLNYNKLKTNLRYLLSEDNSALEYFDNTEYDKNVKSNNTAFIGASNRKGINLIFNNLNFNSHLNNPNVKRFREKAASSIIIISGATEDIGKIIYVNNLICSIFGYTKEELINKSLNKLLPKPISKNHNKLILEFYKSGISSSLNQITSNLIIDKKGMLFSANMFMCYMPNFKYGITFVALIMKDKYFKLSKRETLFLEDINKPCIKMKSNGILILDKDLVITNTNQFCIDQLGIDINLNNNKHIYDKNTNNIASNTVSINLTNKKEDDKNLRYRLKLNKKVPLNDKINQIYDVCNQKKLCLITDYIKNFTKIYNDLLKGLSVETRLNSDNCKNTTSKTLENFSINSHNDVKKTDLNIQINNNANNKIINSKFDSSKNYERLNNVNYLISIKESNINEDILNKTKKEKGILKSSAESCFISLIKRNFVNINNYYIILVIKKKSININNSKKYLDYYNNNNFINTFKNQRNLSYSFNTNTDDVNLNNNELTFYNNKANNKFNISKYTSQLSKTTNNNKKLNSNNNFISKIDIDLNNNEASIQNNEYYQEIKTNLIENSFTPKYAKVSNYTVFFVTLIILIWVVIAYILEVQEVNKLENEKSLYIYSNKIKSIFNYLCINTLLLVKQTNFNVLNINNNNNNTDSNFNKTIIKYSYLRHVVQKSIDNDLRNYKLAIKELHELITNNNMSDLNNYVNNYLYNFINYASNKEDSNNTYYSKLNLLLGLDKTIFHINNIYINLSDINTILNISNYNNYKYIFYNENILYKSDIHPVVIACKQSLAFIASNYSKSIYEILNDLNNKSFESIINNINLSEKKMIIIFLTSLIFCLFVVIVIWILLLKQELFKKEYLKVINLIPSNKVINYINDIDIFQKASDLSFKKEMNIDLIKNICNNEYLDQNLDEKNDINSSNLKFINNINNVKNTQSNNIYNEEDNKLSSLDAYLNYSNFVKEMHIRNINFNSISNNEMMNLNSNKIELVNINSPIQNSKPIYNQINSYNNNVTPKYRYDCNLNNSATLNNNKNCSYLSYKNTNSIVNYNINEKKKANNISDKKRSVSFVAKEALNNNEDSTKIKRNKTSEISIEDDNIRTLKNINIKKLKLNLLKNNVNFNEFNKISKTPTNVINKYNMFNNICSNNKDNLLSIKELKNYKNNLYIKEIENRFNNVLLCSKENIHKCLDSSILKCDFNIGKLNNNESIYKIDKSFKEFNSVNNDSSIVQNENLNYEENKCLLDNKANSDNLINKLNYKINFKTSIIKFIVLTILISSYFLFSLYNFPRFLKTVYESLLIRKDICNSYELPVLLLIEYNFILIFKTFNIENLKFYKFMNNTNSFNTKEYNNDYLNINNLIESTTLSQYNLIKKIKENKIVNLINTYNSNFDLCNEFNIINKNTKIALNCNEFLNKNSNFNYIDISNYIKSKDLNNILSGNNNQRDILYNLFNKQELEKYMIKISIFHRFLVNNIIKEFDNNFKSKFSISISIINFKFILYILIVFLFMIVFHYYMIPNLINNLNNLTRLGLFLDIEYFKMILK